MDQENASSATEAALDWLTGCLQLPPASSSASLPSPQRVAINSRRTMSRSGSQSQQVRGAAKLSVHRLTERCDAVLAAAVLGPSSV
jgi:hypothetical protein